MIDPVLGAARLLQFTSALLLFGATLFRLQVQRTGTDDTAAAPALYRWLLPSAALIGALSGLAWLSAEAQSLTDDWSAVGDVITGTSLGRILALRSALFASALVLYPLIPGGHPRWVILGAIGATATASCAWTGHGASGSGAAGLLHQAADVLHLLAAGVWIGALVDLSLLVLHHGTPGIGVTRRLTRGLLNFSVIGPVVVAVLVLSGVLNSGFLLGPEYRAALFTAYGLVLLVKVALFGGMLALAALNRLRLTPRLQTALDTGTGTDLAVHALRWSLLTETALALLVLAAVALLGMLVPPASGI